MKILVTGGAGYIGSHTVVELLDANYDVVIIDNFSNSSKESLDAIRKITNKDFKFYNIDLLNKDDVKKVFDENPDIEAVIHFAAFKAVGESVNKPIKYYENNIGGTINLVDEMQKHFIKKIVFSSSATVYGSPKSVPIKEDFPKSATNPYGYTKIMNEQILSDLFVADNEWSVILLRYFNPIGAHESGLIGEKPNGIPNNLMPYINKVACGELDHLNVFGDDYPTRDGTGVRDYIHVVDLAKGHLKAIERACKTTGVETYNLGTGVGYSVLEIVNNFEKVNNINIKYEIAPRRAGDIAECYADPTKASELLGWTAQKNLLDMCKDSWRFTKNNL